MATKRTGKPVPGVAPKKTVRARAKKRKVAKRIPERIPERIPTEIGLHASQDMLKGTYCNVATIKHTTREFILDFVLGVDNLHTLVSRVITSPAHAKQLAEVLTQNIAQYEKRFGEIDTSKGQTVVTDVH